MKPVAHKIGAVFYVLWGMMHIMIGGMLLQKASMEGPAAYLLSMNPETSIGLLAFPGMVSGIFAQNAWNLIWFGLLAMVVAIRFNWRNSWTGYWINLSVVSLADAGFVGAILIPGYMKSFEAYLGPLMWILAAFFSTWAVFAGKFRLRPVAASNPENSN